jgi:ABC-type branched-subunit amino acid transport system ATPase component
MNQEQELPLQNIVAITDPAYPMLEGLTWDNVPQLAIITGLNGSGKTKLLDCISENTPDIAKKNTTSSVIFSKNFEKTKHFYKKTKEDFKLSTATARNTIDGYNNSLVARLKEIQNKPFGSAENRSRILADRTAIGLTQNGNIHGGYSIYVQPIQKFTQHNYISQEERDIIIDYLRFMQKPETDYLAFFTSSEESFKVYASLKDINKIEELQIASIFLSCLEKDTKIRASATRQDFSKDEQNKYILDEKAKIGMSQYPWEIINQLLEEYKFKFKVLEPTENDTSSYELKFTGGIKYDTLSTGEKIIFQMVCLAYQGFGGNVAGTKLLLLDEFDAHLNPSMAKMFIDIVQNVLMKQFGMQVMMTTHSPSTVAYAPAESIFWMENGKITQKNKQEVLKDLANGLVLLEDTGGAIAKFISNINKNICIVEGESDVIYLEKMKNHFGLEEGVAFISADSADKMASLMHFFTKLKEATKYTTNNNKKLIGLVDKDTKGRKVKADNSDYKIMTLAIPEEDEKYTRNFKDEKLDYPIEFLLKDAFYQHNELTELGKSLFIKIDHLPSKMEGSNDKERETKRDKINDTLFAYEIKADNNAKKTENSASKVKVAKEIISSPDFIEKYQARFAPTFEAIEELLASNKEESTKPVKELVNS